MWFLKGFLGLVHIFIKSQLNLLQQNLHLRFSLGDQHFIPEIKKNLKWQLCQIETENYYSGYKNITLTLNLNLMFFQSILYLYFHTRFIGHERKISKWTKSRVSLYKSFNMSILLSPMYIMTHLQVTYIHDSWSTSNSVLLETLLCVHCSSHKLLDNHAYANSWELKYFAALVRNEFWDHSPYIVQNHNVIYATKTPSCKYNA